ncbi:GNAT family N-acetyltransferase [Leptobacterium flavescens]|uniref:GNAT family N-acetyltransferase n=1 Tax=Leptobacterium flavescens TaxID=472055 RepID=A0A6P0ULV9_9FLAO|nr:GNAT family N-acetyltransferase [Leptobacterium flavescens]NER14225.1 GNAT family N-acetyltransferase [Leptobacterium flavescens]
MLNIKVKSFKELSSDELYELLELRSEVFVVEQSCIYQDVDGKDRKAIHVLGEKAGKIVAYTRIFKAGDYFEYPSFGRVVVKETERKYGYGHDIIKASVDAIRSFDPESKIKISAQSYLRKFYESHGFFQEGEEYLEDGIPHISMLKE